VVGLLLIAALLVDRFVLLPEFEGSDASAGVALAAWLGVNLLPALAWLALNARKPERTRGQLFAGTLAVVATTAVLIVPVLISWTAR
jgi:drug/metabolite transporter superfamily protein YnfA